MARLDDEVAPFLCNALTVAPRHVSHATLCALAGWAAKVAALHDLSTGNLTVWSQDERRQMKRHQRPPLAVTVWLTAIEWKRDLLPSIDQTTFWWPVAGADPDRPTPDSVSCTIYFGHACLHLFGTTQLKRLTPRGDIGDRLVRIWPSPPQHGITWPASSPLTLAEAAGLARSVEQHFTGTTAPIAGVTV